jgi:hypothetical protein
MRVLPPQAQSFDELLFSFPLLQFGPLGGTILEVGIIKVELFQIF